MIFVKYYYSLCLLGFGKADNYGAHRKAATLAGIVIGLNFLALHGVFFKFCDIDLVAWAEAHWPSFIGRSIVRPDDGVAVMVFVISLFVPTFAFRKNKGVLILKNIKSTLSEFELKFPLIICFSFYFSTGLLILAISSESRALAAFVFFLHVSAVARIYFKYGKVVRTKSGAFLK